MASTTSDFDLNRYRERVVDRCPAFDGEDVDRVTRATLRGLSEQLAPDERAWLATELPAPYASVFERGRPIAPTASTKPMAPSRQALFDDVARTESIDVGVAIEHTEIICRALGEFLSDEVLIMLRKHLPPLAALFESPAPFSPAPGPSPGTESDSSLAAGRPGAKHPLASADADDLAHEHSIARSDDPHADRRISSSHVPTTEREDRTLASGEAGARRRLSDGH